MRLIAYARRLLWYPTVGEITQLCHFALACSAVWGPVAVFGASPWWGCLGVQLFAVVKEYGFDIAVEGDSWANSSLDFGFYLLGAYASLGAVLLARWLQ